MGIITSNVLVIVTHRDGYICGQGTELYIRKYMRLGFIKKFKPDRFNLNKPAIKANIVVSAFQLILR